ncbi:hypothetical protein QGM71_02570 [Virgibacillus sp. C22-A2]|uniref:Uncharacterized protein n=1 Tax=Virgibacillus tibetensis TaxID=3042313 RepID=A0ABU6KD47_9BACI|nr:hypothetical protein [Virgibacillus sp. C22-A2]
MAPKRLVKGDTYRPVVTVIRVKADVPTIIVISGKRYIYQPESMFK